MPVQWLFLATLALILGAFWVPVVVAEAAAAATGNDITMLGYNGGSSSSSSRIGDLEVEGEFLVDSETHRRFLQQGNHLDYSILNPDRSVCNPGRGKSYTGNCIPSPSGNPRSRGCTYIYHDRC